MTLRLYNLLLDFNGLLVAYRFVIGITWDPGGGKYEMGRKNGNWKGDQMNESSNFAFFHTCGNLVEAFNIYRERCVRTRESGTLKMATKLSLIEFCH